MQAIALRLVRSGHHRRNHHTMMKNQKTMMRKTIYQSQRHPCRAAMLFMRRNVPASIPDVSENASFYICYGDLRCPTTTPFIEDTPSDSAAP